MYMHQLISRARGKWLHCPLLALKGMGRSAHRKYSQIVALNKRFSHISLYSQHDISKGQGAELNLIANSQNRLKYRRPICPLDVITPYFVMVRPWFGHKDRRKKKRERCGIE